MLSTSSMKIILGAICDATENKAHTLFSVR
jgi:hypothetical protein